MILQGLGTVHLQTKKCRQKYFGGPHNGHVQGRSLPISDLFSPVSDRLVIIPETYISLISLHSCMLNDSTTGRYMKMADVQGSEVRLRHQNIQ